jgi:hypothetical protein
MPHPTGLLAMGPPGLAMGPWGPTTGHPGRPAMGPLILGQLPQHAFHQVTQFIDDPLNDEINLK